MSAPLIVSSLLVTVLIAVIFLRDLVQRKRDLFSIRNFFLLGVLFFYGIAGMIYGSNPAGFPYVSRGEGMVIIAVALPLFMGCFFLGELLGRKMSGLARFIPPLNLPVTTPALLFSIIATLSFGLFIVAIFRNENSSAGYAAALGLQFRSGMAACAMGLATYYFIAQRFNPLAWAVFGTTFVLATVITTFGGTGRRDWLAVFFSIPWTWYYARLRYHPLLPVAIKLAPIAAVTMVIMISYSAIRHEYGKDVRFEQRIGQLVEIARDPLLGLNETVRVLTSDTPAISSFILEYYPNPYPQKPFNGLFYILAQPIPRAIWPGKPVALGIEVQDQLNNPANLGPGILGHGWAEAGWLGIVYYAIFFGIFVTIIDTAIVQRAHHPFFIAVMGAGLGNVMALPRGDTPLFLIQILAAWISTMVLLYLVRIAAGPLMSGFPSIAIDPPIWNDDQDDPEMTEDDRNPTGVLTM